MTATTTRRTSSRRTGAPRTLVGKSTMFVESRLNFAAPIRKQLNKVFPDHWSFMMGEIALYSFIILLLSGTFLTFWFDASQGIIRYDGSYTPLRNIVMSRSYASTLHLSFDVRGGLFVRQVHHWAALLFIAAMMVHMFRVFFTGAFRKPREFNWLIGLGLLALGIVEGFAGYSLPDDLLSGTGLRIADAIILSIPVIGTYLSFIVFGGEFPGTQIIGRLYIAHVLIIPAILAAMVGAHMALLVRQKHTQFTAPGRTEHTVSGERIFPIYAAKAGGFFFLVSGVIAALGGLVQINPVFYFGPYIPSRVSSFSQPDWYMMFLDGSTRLFPAWEIRGGGFAVPPLLWPTVVLPGILGGLAAFYPFIEAKMTNDRGNHSLLQRPRDVPVRTSLGVMAITFYIVLTLSGANDVIARVFDVSLNAMTWAGRIALLILPPIGYWFAYRVCLGLQRHDREVLEHGIETGIIKRLATGEFIEVHQPLGQVDDHGHGLLPYAGTAVPKKMNKLGASALRHARGFFTPVHENPEIEEAIRAINPPETEQRQHELTD